MPWQGQGTQIAGCLCSVHVTAAITSFIDIFGLNPYRLLEMSLNMFEWS